MLTATVDYAAALRRVLEKWAPSSLSLELHDGSLSWSEAASLLSECGVQPRKPDGALRENLVVVKPDCMVAYLHPPGVDIFAYTNYEGRSYSSTTAAGRLTPQTFETNGGAL